MNKKHLRLLLNQTLWSSLLGFIAFCLIIGPQFLNPFNTSWIPLGDYTWLAAGSLSFIHSSWHFPFGAFNQFTYPFDSAVVYATSVPWLVLILKLFRHFLPTSFQYIGPWIALCFVLQGYFAAKLIGRFVQNKRLILLGSAFFILMPAFIYRIMLHGNLVCQWSILAALCLYFDDRFRRVRLAWLLLMILLVGMHLYLYVMCFALLLAYLIRDAIKRSAYLSNTGFLCLILLVSLTCAWLLGYFVIPVSDARASGFGALSMNLLGPLNPLSVVNTHIMPNMPGVFKYQYEGFNYLGVGVLFLILISLCRFSKTRIGRAIDQHRALLVICVLMMVFAWSDAWRLGTMTIAFIQLPKWLLFIGEVFRASGRFFWPVGYLVLLTVLIIIARSFKPKIVVLLLSVALLLQVTDLMPLYGRHYFETANTHPVKLSSKWHQMIKGIKHVALLQKPHNKAMEYAIVWFCVENHLTFNVPDIARVDQKSRGQLLNKQLSELQAGHLAPNTLYVIQEPRRLPNPLPARVRVQEMDGVYGVRVKADFLNNTSFGRID